MRKTFFLLILAAGLTACGGSGGSTFGDDSVRGNFISTTVDLEQRFLYALNSDEGSVSGFLISSGEEGGHDHEHTHAQTVLAQDDHDHEHEGEGGDEEEGLSLVELDSSPYTFGGAAPIDMVVDGAGENLFLLDSEGNLRPVAIDGVTGLLTPLDGIATGVSNPRMLRLSQSGDAVAVLGDQLAIYAVDRLQDRAFVEGTADWNDVRLSGLLGVGATPGGAVGFSWLPEAVIQLSPEVALPGGDRGQIAYAEAGVFVVNGEDGSLSLLDQGSRGGLSLLATFPVPDELTAPETIAALFDGEDLVVGDADSVVLLHPHEDELEEEGHADLDQTPTILFPIPESSFVLAGHAEGEGYHVLEVGEGGLEVLQEAEAEHAGISAFGYAERFETVTETFIP